MDESNGRKHMSELQQYLELMLKSNIKKIIISNPFTKSEEYKNMKVSAYEALQAYLERREI